MTSAMPTRHWRLALNYCMIVLYFSSNGILQKGEIMPTPCYLSVEGITQGNITAGAFTGESVGNVYVEGHEDEMLVQSVDHSLVVPTDRQSGQPSGQREHYPLSAKQSYSVTLQRLNLWGAVA